MSSIAFSDLPPGRTPGIQRGNRILRLLPPLFAAVLVVAGIGLSGRAAAQAPRPYRAAVHVHSNFSSGEFSVNKLAKMAEEDGLSILVLTDHARLSMTWGVYPIQNVLRVRQERRSVFQAGVGRYLAAVAEANRAHPKVLIIPGIEAAAHYHFSGDPFKKNLVAHNWRRHMHILGLNRPEDFLSLPVAGGVSPNLLLDRGASAFPRTVWPYLFSAIYGFGVLIGILFMFRRGFRRFLGFLIFVAFVPLAVNELPVVKPPSDPYGGDPGILPYQALINAAVKKGGVVLWAHQGSLLNKQNLGPVTLETDPNPDVLIESTGYTAFDAIYEDNFVASKPGRQWDRVLGEYIQNKRKTPVWAYGGVDYHNKKEIRSRKRLSDIQTVFLLKKRSKMEVLTALQEGRMYVVRGYGPARLRLDRFEVISRDRNLMALSGETLTTNTPSEIRFRISASDDSTRDLTVQLIRNGKVIRTFKGKTPLEMRHVDTESLKGKTVYYRLDAQVSRSAHLITNPIFVKRQ